MGRVWAVGRLREGRGREEGGQVRATEHPDTVQLHQTSVLRASLGDSDLFIIFVYTTI